MGLNSKTMVICGKIVSKFGRSVMDVSLNLELVEIKDTLKCYLINISKILWRSCFKTNWV